MDGGTEKELRNTLCSFSCYESPRRLDDAAAGGLVNEGVVIFLFFNPGKIFLIQIVFGQFMKESL